MDEAVEVPIVANNELPGGMAVDLPSAWTCGPSGQIFLALGHQVMIYDPATLKCYAFCGTKEAGYAEGEALKAKFNSIWGLAFTADGELLIADSETIASAWLRKIELLPLMLELAELACAMAIVQNPNFIVLLASVLASMATFSFGSSQSCDQAYQCIDETSVNLLRKRE
jgi:hypothetical protein